ncbi:MAG: hypothetical protein HYT80_01130 [Euryarchaeota archaeon]|nr:hypothetical protein [Euryarchaeota archaeon]
MDAAPACFNAISRAMPLLRAETARRLVREGLHQERIAEHLGVSQAMVSKYLRRPPRGETVLSPKMVEELVDASVRVALAEESRGRVPAWCPLCTSLCDAGLSCSLKRASGLTECLRQDEPRAQNRAEAVLASLAEAEQRIRRMPFRHLMPEVRANLAMALPDARDSRDVAAFPGRFVQIRHEVKAASPPELGSSSHLAQVLLKIRRHQPEQAAILNTRFGDDVRRAARAAGLRLQVLKRTRADLSVRVPKAPPADAVVDPGAFGIEPALYVLGQTAIDVVGKAGRILDHLSGAKDQP